MFQEAHSSKEEQNSSFPYIYQRGRIVWWIEESLMFYIGNSTIIKPVTKYIPP